MEKIIAYCGLVCTECPAFIATRDNDVAALKQLAATWYQEPDNAEYCVCDGCIVDGRKNNFCAHCQVRACAIGRGLVNCAHCSDYGCAKLAGFWESVPDSKTTLDSIRLSV
jgi:hypothetical protein